MTDEENIVIKRYTEKDELLWDDFVFNKSINGTFLQSRNFLNYHPKDRFFDYSLLFYLKGKVVAVCPACMIDKCGKTFVSHQGSTYGGLVLGKEVLRLEIIVSLIELLQRYLIDNGFNRIIMKPTMSLLCKEQDEALLYALSFCGFTEYKELNLYIDYSVYNKDIITNLSKLKKRQINRCVKEGLVLRKIAEKRELEDFYEVLKDNLKKFNKEPVHSVDELLDLRQRFPDTIKFYGAYLNDELLSCTMVFEFPDSKCAHTQYLAAKNVEGNLSPMSFIYYSMVDLYRECGYKYLSWGIATEHYGEGINWGLMRNKEEYGSLHIMNRIYEKELK